MDEYQLARERLAAERRAAGLRLLLITTAVALGAGIGLLWDDASSFHGLVRVGGLGSLAGSVALLLTHPKTK